MLARRVGVAGEFAVAGHRIDEIETRLLLAAIDGALGHREAAIAELREAYTRADECGAIRLARRARAALLELGHATDPDVRPSESCDRAAPRTPSVGEGDAVERIVSVFFADVRGFTPLAAAVAPADLAGRIAAGAGEILLSAEAYRRVRPWLEERGLPACGRVLELKGLADPVTAYVISPPVAAALADPR